MDVIKGNGQCKWLCPECKRRCGGIVGHGGMHQCPTHYNPPEARMFYENSRFAVSVRLQRLVKRTTLEPLQVANVTIHYENAEKMGDELQELIKEKIKKDETN